MTNNESIKEKSARRLSELKAQIEYLNMKLHLGANEARDEFEIQKKNLDSWIREINERLGKLHDEGSIKAAELRTKLDELRVQTALGKAETEDALNEQQQNLNRKLNEVRNELSDAYNSAGDKAKGLAEELKEQAENYQTRFDMLKVQLGLGKAEARDEWEKQKKELSVKLNELQKRADSFKEEAKEKLDGFSREMSESWKHFRKAFRQD